MENFLHGYLWKNASPTRLCIRSFIYVNDLPTIVKSSFVLFAYLFHCTQSPNDVKQLQKGSDIYQHDQERTY